MNESSTAAWRVLKFGGTSVASIERWRQIAQLMRARHEGDCRVLLVVSALSGVTNLLQRLLDERHDAAVAADVLAEIKHKHALLANDMGEDVSMLDPCWDELQGNLKALQAQEDFALHAAIMAVGEWCSSTLGAAFLNTQGLACGWLRAADWLTTKPAPNQSAWANRMLALCEAQADDDWRARFGQQGSLLITQGFVAAHPEGGLALLGRGGSDTSAAYFAARLKAECLEIWTDVPGMFSANPKLIPEARLIRQLDFDEAQEMAITGAKILHPRSIQPCRDAQVPIHILDTSRPEQSGTLIAPSVGRHEAGVKAISALSNIVLVSMETLGMWQQVGYLADLFDAFKKHGLSVDLVSTSETNVTVSLDANDNLLSSSVLEKLCQDLAKICRVRVIAACASITLVGRGMRSMMHELSSVFAEVGQGRVHLISQSSNNLNLTFVVEQAMLDSLLPRLHSLVIEGGALRADNQQVFGPRYEDLDASEADIQAKAPWWHAQVAKLKNLGEQHTPQYVYHLPTITQRFEALAQQSRVDQVFYACKANSHPAILRHLAKLGAGMECVSQAEVDWVRKHVPDLPMNRILFTPNFAPRCEYETVLGLGAHVTIDSAYPLAAWPELFAGREIMLRVDPGRGAGHHQKVKTAGKEAKFGIPTADVDEVLALVDACGARVVGLHAHVGSGVQDPYHWQRLMLDLGALAKRIPSVRVLDVGGGFPVLSSYRGKRFELEQCCALIAEAKAALSGLDVWLEPGRLLVAEAGGLLLTVTQVVRKGDVTRVGCDGGMNALMRPALYDAWHPIDNLSQWQQPVATPVDVVGPICESGDVLGRRRYLPETQEGDVLWVSNAGAYGMTMASTYNCRALPTECVLDE